MKHIITLFFYILALNIGNAQEYLGGEILVEESPNSFTERIIYVNLYYTNTSNIKDSIQIYYFVSIDGGFFHKVSTQISTNNIYKVTYKGYSSMLHHMGTTAIKYIDTVDMSNIVNIGESNYEFELAFVINEELPHNYLLHTKKTPIFDYPPSFVNINGSTASLSFKCSQYDSDTIMYSADSTFFDEKYIPLPNGFSFDETTAILSWDTTMTGKYLVNIAAWQNHRGLSVTTSTYRTIIIDTDMDNSLYIPVNTEVVQEKDKLLIELSPNPTSEILQITTQKPLNEIQLYNALGQQVHQQQGLQQTQVTINVGDLPKGMYIVRVRQGENWGSEQVVIQ